MAELLNVARNCRQKGLDPGSRAACRERLMPLVSGPKNRANFSAYVKAIENKQKMLHAVTKAFYSKKGAKDTAVVFGEGGSQAEMKASDLTYWGREIREDLQSFRLLSTLQKQRKKRVVKEFSGVRLPVALGPATQAFMQSANFGYVDPLNPGSGALIDRLPLIRQGRGLRVTLTSMFFLNMKAQALQDPAQNEIVIGAQEPAYAQTLGAIPSLYVPGEWNQVEEKYASIEPNYGPDGQPRSATTIFQILENENGFRMAKAQAAGGNPRPFTPGRFYMTDFPRFLSWDVYRKPDAPADLADVGTRARMLQEAAVVSGTLAAWKAAKQAREKAEGGKRGRKKGGR